jgi:cholesterol oxidase
VRQFKYRSGEGYVVYYRQHEPDPAREGQKTDTDRLPEHRITTDRLILAAGTLGTTFLMLKNSGAFPGLSPRLGTRFCGNGDLITFASRSRRRDANGEWVPRLIDAGYGPVITSAVRVADREDGGDGRGFYVEDAGYAEFVNWMLQVFDTPGALLPWWHGAGWGILSRWLGLGLLGRGLLWRSAGRRLRKKWFSDQPETDMGAEISALFGENQTSAGLLPMLGMGRDIPNGKMKLSRGRLDVDWSLVDSDLFFQRVRETMKSISDELGARFSDPLERINRVVTVHPLGGCPMGRNATEGVVNSYGAVFGCPPGLYIADGSVMPGPVGPNPSLTIAALADRFADPIIELRGPEE